MPRDRVGHLWVLHAKSVPRNGLWERRGLEYDADEPRLPSRAIDYEEAAVQSAQEKAHMTTALFQGAISAISFSAMLVMFASVIGLVWWLCSTVFAIVAEQEETRLVQKPHFNPLTVHQ